MLDDIYAIAVYLLILSSVLVTFFELYLWYYGQTAAQFLSMAVVMLTWEIYVGASLVFIVAIALITLVVIARLSKTAPGIFLSYHHSNYEYVLDLASSILDKGMRPLYVEFTAGPNHDALLDLIYPKISEADFFICLPSLEPSFVESEVAYAIAAQKSIFIVLPDLHRGIPDTSQKSYPVLRLDQLKTERFNSVLGLIQYLYGDWRHTIKLLCGSVRSSENPLLLLIKTIILIPTMALIAAAGVSYGMSLIEYEFFRFRTYLIPIIHFSIPDTKLFDFAFLIPEVIGWLLIVMGGKAIHATWVRWRARLIVRRQIEQGIYSFQSLDKLFDEDSRQFLTAFFTDPPGAHHELPIDQIRSSPPS
jgi:hypothetical protein